MAPPWRSQLGAALHGGTAPCAAARWHGAADVGRGHWWGQAADVDMEKKVAPKIGSLLYMIYIYIYYYII